MELRLGIMTNKELAEWFGIKEGTLKNQKKQRLEKLKEYAKFEEIKGKVNIIEIYSAEYKKKLSNYKFIKQKTQELWDKSGLDMCTFVAQKIKEKYADKINTTDATLYNYVCKAKSELWGNKNKNNGEIGYCKRQLAKKINNKCIEFSEEESGIKEKLRKKYLGNANEKLEYIKKLLEDNNLNDEELEILLMKDNLYQLFEHEVEIKLHCKVARATKVTANAF